MNELKILITAVFFALALWMSIRVKPGKDQHGMILDRISFRRTGLVGWAILVIWLFFQSSIGFVPAGYRGIVLRFSAVTGKILGQGLYLVTPLAETVELSLVQTQAYTAGSDAASFDLQDVKTTVTLNYSLMPDAVVRIYDELRHEYQNRIIEPAIQEAVKAATAQFKAMELIQSRERVRETIENLLKERLTPKGILVDKVNITNFSFSAEFQKAIEQKVTATELALKAQRDLERVKFEAEQKIAQAKAEAEALRLQKENVTSQLVELRRIEAQIKAIEKWNGVMPNVVTGTGPVPLLDVFQAR